VKVLEAKSPRRGARKIARGKRDSAQPLVTRETEFPRTPQGCEVDYHIYQGWLAFARSPLAILLAPLRGD
jgi:hypothetical protein